jgi:hypothetical protein
MDVAGAAARFRVCIRISTMGSGRSNDEYRIRGNGIVNIRVMLRIG